MFDDEPLDEEEIKERLVSLLLDHETIKSQYSYEELMSWDIEDLEELLDDLNIEIEDED